MLRRFAGLIAVLPLACGAPSTKEPDRTPAPPRDQPEAQAPPDAGPADATAGAIEFAKSGTENYKRGVTALEAGEWAVAATYFVHVQERYPYSRIGVLSELRWCDAALGAKQYRAAFEGYNRFASLHPIHDEVKSGYVHVKAAEATLRSLIEDDMDAAARLAGLRELDAFYVKFLAEFPASPHRGLAIRHRDEAARQLEKVETNAP